jgi:hypothetical protein
MAKDYTNKKILYGGLAFIFVITIIWISVINSKVVEDYEFPGPDKVVEQYFTSWSNKDYPNMYSTISDGFKKIESSAKDFQEFKSYVNSQDIETINIINIETIDKDEETATVNYNVEFISKEGATTPYEGTFTLKYRIGDIIRGWKLIHPYGENIDNT